MKQKIKDLILQELLFLQNCQSENGGFLSVSFCDAEKFSDAQTRHTTFYTSLILLCLQGCGDIPLLQLISGKGTAFLLDQKSPHWSWNYWQRNSQEAQTFPCPDDLDDTCTALSCIGHCSPQTIDEKALVAIINLLISCEEQAGGPYHTWIVGNRGSLEMQESWKDVDIAVNSNIMNFLKQQGVELPSLVDFIEKPIDASEFISKYYHSPVTIIYFISRWYRGLETKKLQHMLLQRKNSNGLWDNPLETSLAVSAYLRLGGRCEDVEKAVASLSERTDTNRLPYPFFIERILNNPENQLIKNKKHTNPDNSPATKQNPPRIFYSGSPALTSACQIEALCLYEKALEQNSSANFESGKNAPQQKHIEHVISSTKKYFSKYSASLQSKLAVYIEKVVQQGLINEIALLSFLFHTSLRPEFKNKDDTKRVIDAASANLLGWIGYTIYDDLLDGEGDIGLLPLANTCVREVANIFRKLFPDAKTFRTFERIVGDIDQANLWEYASCKLKIISGTFAIPSALPDYESSGYSILAKKSLGHALGPIALTLRLISQEKMDKGEHLKQAHLVEEFFTRYLIARQLNDDAHDWLSDLEKGYLNPVSVKILAKMREKQPTKTEITLSSDAEALQSIFWNEIIDEISEKILTEAKVARQVLQEISILEDTSYLESLLTPIEKSAEKALAERDSMVRFLKAYR